MAELAGTVAIAFAAMWTLRIVVYVTTRLQARAARYFGKAIILLCVGVVTDGHGIIGREGLIGIYLMNPTIDRAKVNGRVLDTGSIKVRITEGPLRRLPAIVASPYTVTYWDCWVLLYARPAWPP